MFKFKDGEQPVQELRDAAGNLLACVIRFRPDWAGQEFYTDSSEQLQVGAMRWPAEHVVEMHRHRDVERKVVGTGEVLVVLDGMVRVDVTSDGRTESVRAGYGDVVVFQPGSVHGLVVLDEARLIEVKQGPYVDRAADKEDRHAQEEQLPDPLPEGASAGG